MNALDKPLGIGRPDRFGYQISRNSAAAPTTPTANRRGSRARSTSPAGISSSTSARIASGLAPNSSRTSVPGPPGTAPRTRPTSVSPAVRSSRPVGISPGLCRPRRQPPARRGPHQQRRHRGPEHQHDQRREGLFGEVGGPGQRTARGVVGGAREHAQRLPEQPQQGRAEDRQGGADARDRPAPRAMGRATAPPAGSRARARGTAGWCSSGTGRWPGRCAPRAATSPRTGSPPP